VLRALLCAAAICIAAASARAEAWRNGPWLVSATPDPISGGNSYVAVLNDKGNGNFIIRCMNRTLSAGFVETNGSRFEIGDKFNVTFRGDSYPIVQAIGYARKANAIEFPANATMAREVLASEIYSVQYVNMDRIQITHTWRTYGKTLAAFDRLRKECPIE
jgi:hypothetical protein